MKIFFILFASKENSSYKKYKKETNCVAKKLKKRKMKLVSILFLVVYFVSSSNGLENFNKALLNSYLSKSQPDLISFNANLPQFKRETINPFISQTEKLQFNFNNNNNISRSSELDRFQIENSFNQTVDEFKELEKYFRKYFGFKESELENLYEKASANIRLNAVNSEKFLSKKGMIVQQLIQNLIRFAENIVNGRIELAYASIEAKKAEAESYLKAVGNQIAKDLSALLKQSQDDFLNLIQKERSLLEADSLELNNKISLFYKDLEASRS